MRQLQSTKLCNADAIPCLPNTILPPFQLPVIP